MIDELGDDADGGLDDAWASALSEQKDLESSGGKPKKDEKPKKEEKYKKPTFEMLEKGVSSEGGSEDVNLDVILDIPVTLSVEIGRTRLNIRNLLQLNQGSVVELDRLAGEPMDVLVNGTLIAHGEVVVVNEKFGIRLTDVISAAERVKKLK